MEIYLGFGIEKLSNLYQHNIYRVISDPGPRNDHLFLIPQERALSVLKQLHIISRIQNELHRVNFVYTLQRS